MKKVSNLSDKSVHRLHDQKWFTFQNGQTVEVPDNFPVKNPLVLKDASVKAKDSKPEKAKKKVEKRSGLTEAVSDDYLGRNSRVVVKNIRSDNLDSDSLKLLLKVEKEGKDRQIVIDAIKEML